MSNKKICISNKTLYYFAFSIIGLITFFPLFFTGFATADDLHNYLITTRGDIMEDASFFAKIAGRFYFHLVKPVYSLPYLSNNMVVVKMFQYIPLFACFILFAKIIKESTKSDEISWLMILLFLVTMQISKHTTLFVAYPFYFSFSFFLLLFSFYLLMIFYKTGRKRNLVGSAIFFGVALLFYETYIFFILFALSVIIINNFQKNIPFFVRVKKWLFHFLPFLTIALLYLVTYFIFRHYFPPQYPGTNFATKDASLGTFFKILWSLSYSAFPLTIYESSHEFFFQKSEFITGHSKILLFLFQQARVEWIVKGILVGWLGWILLKNLPEIPWKKVAGGCCIAILLVFVPHIPLALTEKYTFYVEKAHMIGYLTTFFSFFGVLLFGVLLISYLINLFNFNKIIKNVLIALFVIAICLCSVITDYSNYYIAKDIRSANLRFRAIDELVKSKQFKILPPNTPFYAPDLWNNTSECARGITEQAFNWYEYFQAKTGNLYPFSRVEGQFLFYTKKVTYPSPYYMTMCQAEKTDDLFLVMAPLPTIKNTDTVIYPISNTATILYYSPYKIFTVSFRVYQGEGLTDFPIKINHINDKMTPSATIEINVYNTHREQAATIFVLQYPGIDLNSIMISNMINSKNKYFYL
ncbi:MAG: hypothetical protein M0P47_04205 [Bacteroidales bacterium]|nr:hypothetical protein [Bacteroidales bacterium]